MCCAKPILLVEDDPVDARAIRRALGDSDASDAVIHTSSAEEALAYLRAPTHGRPALILLDLKMPGTNGLTFLGVIKGDPSLSDIPIVALTNSHETRDITDSFDLGAAGYMVKASDYASLAETIRTIQNYWSLNRLPTSLAQ
ncbi:MAG: response regulator [Phycisphaerales bacterium]